MPIDVAPDVFADVPEESRSNESALVLVGPDDVQRAENALLRAAERFFNVTEFGDEDPSIHDSDDPPHSPSCVFVYRSADGPLLAVDSGSVIPTAMQAKLIEILVQELEGAEVDKASIRTPSEEESTEAMEAGFIDP